MNLTKRVNSIDVLRLVAAFFIVVIHAPLFGGEYLKPLARFAVPIFFMISGYFYCTADKKKKRKQIKNIFVLTIIANLGYIAFKLVNSLSEEGMLECLKRLFGAENMFKFLVFNESPFASHLWFLSALLYAMIIEYFISSFLWKKRAFPIAIISVLLIANLVLGKYGKLIFGMEIDQIYIRNFIFYGIPFLLLGSLIKRINPQNIKISTPVLVVLTLLFEGTTFLENYLLEKADMSGTVEFYISTFFVTLFAFLIAVKNPASNPGKVTSMLANSGRKYSLAIYIIHPLVFRMCTMIVPRFGATINNLYKAVACVLVFVAVWIMAVIYYKIKDTIKAKFKKTP